VQRALKGGWLVTPRVKYKLQSISRGGVVTIEFTTRRRKGREPVVGTSVYPIGELLLTPKVWRAVGKTKGWTTGRTKPHKRRNPRTGKIIRVGGNSWKVHQRRFIDTINNFRI